METQNSYGLMITGSGLAIQQLRSLSERGLEGESHEAISCRLRRLGYRGVSAERDVNGMLWERVTVDQQAAEIR